MSPLVIQRFLEIYDRSPAQPNGCRIWAGSMCNGYGRLKVKGETYKAHRISYEIHKGQLPDGMLVCHKCDTPACVAPTHLWQGTHADNQRDCAEKSRRAKGDQHGHTTEPQAWPRGVTHHLAKLDDTKVRVIRSLGGSMSQQAIADLFGTTQNNVSLILRRKAWKHVL